MTQVEKAIQFRALHKRGAPLVLYNIWDAGSAKAVADAGARALATGSWSLAAAQGYADGQQLPIDSLLQIVGRITATCDVPVSVDFEGGYAAEPDALATNIRRLIDAGAIGINFEDQIIDGRGLHDIRFQSARIKAIRTAADDSGIQLFINARTDLFLKAGKGTDHASLMDEALARASAYAQAGADGFFIPGLTEADLVRKICDEVALPVNVMMRGALGSPKEAATLGISRASYGPTPFVNAMKDLAAQAAQIEA